MVELCPEDTPEDGKIWLARFLVGGGSVAKLPTPYAVLKKLLEREEELGEFIAGPDATGLRGYVQEGYRHRCRELSNVPGWARALGGFAFGSASRICKPYWDQNDWDAPTNEPQFTGGQCPGVLYNADANITFAVPGCDTISGFGNQANGIPGPISVRSLNTLPPQPGGLCPGFSFTGVQIVDGTGTVRGNFGSGAGARFIALNVTRVDGLPDDCGDPDPIREPGPNPSPDPGPLPGPEPTDDPNDPTGPPLFPIPPFNDPLGGPVEIVAEPDPGPGLEPTDIPGNPDTAPGGGDDVGAPIDVDPGPGGGGEETDFGEPPAGRSWVGCSLRFDFPETAGAIAGSGPQNPVSPRVLGNASLVYDGLRGDAFQVRSASMVLTRPTGALKVTGVFVNSEPGITYTVRPLSLKNCPDNECSQED